MKMYYINVDPVGSVPCGKVGSTAKVISNLLPYDEGTLKVTSMKIKPGFWKAVLLRLMGRKVIFTMKMTFTYSPDKTFDIARPKS